MDVATILGQVAPALWAAKTQPIGAHEDFISKFNALVRGVRLVKVPEKVSVKPFVKKEVYHLFAEHDDGRRVPLGRHEAVLGTGYAQAALQNLLQVWTRSRALSSFGCSHPLFTRVRLRRRSAHVEWPDGPRFLQLSAFL